MRADFFYRNSVGRALVVALQKTGAFRLSAWFLRTPLSRPLAARYIKNNGIDMTPFEGQSYRSFSEFFARKKNTADAAAESGTLISPCDGLLTVYPVSDELFIPMKGSRYRIIDLVPDEQTAQRYRDGLCLVFRLQASDYHHFCAIDDLVLGETHYIPGLLHSVQPIACETVPVYRLNRRWWSVLETENFGEVIQIEVGAMLVGGVTFAKVSGKLRRGEEMGNFELAGSTIVVLVDSSVRDRLRLTEPYNNAVGGTEVPVKMGREIGRICSEA